MKEDPKKTKRIKVSVFFFFLVSKISNVICFAAVYFLFGTIITANFSNFAEFKSIV